MATRILYVITKANWGGAQSYVYDLALEAKSAGHDVAVAYGEEGELAERLRSAGIRTIQLSELTRNISLLREIRSFFSLLRVLRRERPDVIHVNSSKAGGLGCLAGRIMGVPRIIFTAHGWAFNEARPWWQKFFIYKLAWLTVLLSHTTICVSDAVRRDISWLPFVKRKCRVIYNGVSGDGLLEKSLARSRLAPRSVSKYWIGMLSELHPTKNLDTAIRAFASIAESHPEASLIVIGGGELRGELEHLIRDLHMSQRIMLVGHIEDARHYLSAFDLFVHTSTSEGLGLVILEAGCAALPVVAARVGGIPEIIPDDAHGLLLPPRNPEALAIAIESLMNNPQRAAELGARLRARIQNSFSKQEMLSKTFSLY